MKKQSFVKTQTWLPELKHYQTCNTNKTTSKCHFIFSCFFKISNEKQLNNNVKTIMYHDDRIQCCSVNILLLDTAMEVSFSLTIVLLYMIESRLLFLHVVALKLNSENHCSSAVQMVYAKVVNLVSNIVIFP